MEIISRYSTTSQCLILLSIVLWLILKSTDDNRSKKADTESNSMTLISSFVFRIKIIQIEEERSEKLTNNMKLLIFLAVTLGTIVTGLDSVSFEIKGVGGSLGTTSGFDCTSALDSIVGFWLELFLLPLCVHIHLLHMHVQEKWFWTFGFSSDSAPPKMSASVQLVKTSCNNHEIYRFYFSLNAI